MVQPAQMYSQQPYLSCLRLAKPVKQHLKGLHSRLLYMIYRGHSPTVIIQQNVFVPLQLLSHPRMVERISGMHTFMETMSLPQLFGQVSLHACDGVDVVVHLASDAEVPAGNSIMLVPVFQQILTVFDSKALAHCGFCGREASSQGPSWANAKQLWRFGGPWLASCYRPC